MLLPDQSLVKQRSLCTKGENELQRYLGTESEVDSGKWRRRECLEGVQGGLSTGFTELLDHDSDVARFGEQNSW